MSAWTAWDLFDDVTRVFCALPMNPENIHTEMPVLERFVVLLYHKISSKLEVNESRFELFSAMNRQTDNILPTAASLVEHTERAVFQANVWHQIDRKETNELDPASFGWRVIERKWKSHWSDLPKVSSMSTPYHECTLHMTSYHVIETINGYF